jgi:hypothetical protein
LEQNTTRIKYRQSGTYKKKRSVKCHELDTYRNIITRQRRNGKRTIQQEVPRESQKNK